MNRYYFDWQENGYYDQTENIMQSDKIESINQNNTTKSSSRKAGKPLYNLITMFTVTVFAAGVLVVIGTKCLIS